MEIDVRVPAALHRWAAEHNQQLSPATRSEVDVIASIIDASSMRNREIDALGDDFASGLREVFPDDRAERARTLVDVVAGWVAQLPPDASRTTVAEIGGRAPTGTPGAGAGVSRPASAGFDDRPAQPQIAAPAFLRSDKVDEDDNARLYGTARSYVRIVLAATSVMALIAVGIGVWLWAAGRSTDTIDTTATEAATSDTSTGAATEGGTGDPPTAVPSAEPTTADPTESIVGSSSWADTTTILNSGSSEILSSTYPVSPANRAVLTGHAGAITGIVVSDEGRVLTGGSDRRLVDWGADVTLTSPDILEVDHPLTVLARTADHRLLAGDAVGNIIVIDLVNIIDPIVLAVHTSAISAVAEIGQGRVVVASVDGDVHVLDLADPSNVLEMPHRAEVTAVEPLADGTIATASVDGLVRIWSPGASEPSATISTLNAPITALARLDDATLAAASVDGRIHIVEAANDSAVLTEIRLNAGAIRALYPFDDVRNGPSLAAGGDDSTIRLISLDTGAVWRQLDGHGDLVSAIDQLPDRRLVSTSADGTGRVWNLDLAPGTPVEPPHNWNISAVTSWTNDQLVTAGVDGLVMLVSTTEATSPEEITRHQAPVVGLVVMPNGDIVSLDSASLLMLSQVGPNAADDYEFAVAPGATALAALAQLGVATGHADGTVRFTDFTAEIGAIDAHEGGITALLGLSDGRVASAGNDNVVKLLDFEAPDDVEVFDQHVGAVTAMTELADGRIASAGSDGIYVWSPDDVAAEALRLSGHQVSALTLLALPDGRLLSSSVDGRVRLWDLLSPESEPITLVDVPGIVNPHLAQADNGLFVAGAGRGYVVFTIE